MFTGIFTGIVRTKCEVVGPVDANGVRSRTVDRGGVVVGDTVNIDRSSKFGDEVGGRLVSGHISGRRGRRRIVGRRRESDPAGLCRSDADGLREGGGVNIEPDTQPQTIVETFKSVLLDTDLREQGGLGRRQQS